MNGLAIEKTMTTKELSEALGVSSETIRLTAKKIINPSKLIWRVINGGKSLVFTESQATAIKTELQNYSKVAQNGFTTERTMTIKEVADALGAGYDVIASKARELGFTRNGVKTFLTLDQVQMLKDNYRPSTFEVATKVNNAVTDIDIERMTLQVIQYHQNRIHELELENKEQKQKLAEQQPKVEFFDEVAGSNDTIDMKEVAKILNVKNIGRNKLFEILRQNHILDKNNQPYQHYVDAGYFKVIEKKYNLPDGSVKICLKTVVFQKGLDYIRKQVEVA